MKTLEIIMESIDAKKVKELKKQNPNLKIINVLPTESYRKEHIPGSINIPLEEGDFMENVRNIIGGKDSKVVVYCASQSCPASEKAARKLEEAGFSQVMDFERGIEGWKEAGEEIESS